MSQLYPKEIALIVLEYDAHLHLKGEEEKKIKENTEKVFEALRTFTFTNEKPDERPAKYADKLKLIDKDLTASQISTFIRRGFERLRQYQDVHGPKVEAMMERLKQLRMQALSARTDPLNPFVFYPVSSGGGKPKSGGNGPASGGGPADAPIIDRQSYTLEAPKVSNLQKIETVPCMYEQKVTKGKNGYWQFKCDRVASVPSAQYCELHRVEENQSVVVPRDCLTEYVDILKGYNVTTTRNKDPVTDQESFTQEVVPQVERLGRVRVSQNEGPEIRYKRSQPVSGGEQPKIAGAAVTVKAESKTKMTKTPIGVKNVITPASALAKPLPAASSGGAVEAGSVSLPNQGDVRRKDFVMTDLDIQEQQLHLPPGMIRKPDELQKVELSKIVKPNTIGFFDMTDYGSVRTDARRFGFPFPMKHMPYGYLSQVTRDGVTEDWLGYLGWLVSVHYKLRTAFQSIHTYVFDVRFATIALVEDQILTTFGKLEANGILWKRSDFFVSQEVNPTKFRPIMNKILRAYVFTPETEIWVSPLSSRYLEVQMDETASDYRKEEKDAFLTVERLYLDIAEASRTKGYQTSNGTKVQIELPAYPPEYFNNITNSMAIVEDELLALLARLQHLGFVLNSDSETFNQSIAPLLELKHRRYLSDTLVNYFRDFYFDDRNFDFYRVPELRAQMAKQVTGQSSFPGKRSIMQNMSDWQPVVTQG